MNITSERISVVAIDTAFDAFSPSWPGESRALEESIARVGVIQTPLLAERGGRLVAVCGLRRVRAARRLSLDALECRICRDPSASDAVLLAMNLEDNLAVRELRLLEKARFVKLTAGLDESARKDLRKRFGPLLGLSEGGSETERLLALDALPQDVKSFIDSKAMPARLAFPIADLGGRAAAFLAALAAKHRLTAAQAAEFAELGREVAQREQRGFDSVARELDDGLDPDRAPRRGWRETLMERLRVLRYPAWKEKDGAMRKCLDAVNGTPGVTVRPPPFFEGDALRAEIVFHSPAELSDLARALALFAASGSARRAFELL